MAQSKRIIMVGTHLQTMGGISSVVSVYRDAGLFERLSIRYLVTHRDGTASQKVVTAAKAWGELAWLLLRDKVLLVHVHMSHRASCWRKLLFIWPAYFRRVPVVIHLHGSEFAEFFDQECKDWQQRLIRRSFHQAARVIVLSESWRRWVRGMCPTARVITLHNPVAVPEVPGKSPQGALLFLGRLGERKGTYDLLEAIKRLSKRGTVPEVWLCGDGELENCEAVVREAGLSESVKFLGWVRGADKDRLLKTASVYVLPSYREGLPMSVLEAMAAGLPVVSTRIGGIPEAIRDGVEGYLIDAGDVSALEDRLSRLISSPDHANSMGIAAHRRVKAEFSSEVIVPRLEALYVDIQPTAKT